MAHQPDNGQAERDYQNEKNNPAFAAFFAEGFPASSGAAIISPARVLERDRDIEPASPFARPRQQFLTLPPGRFLGDPRRLGDHALQFLHLAAQLRFALREFFLFLVERRPGLRRSAAHAGLLDLRRHPKENQQRNDAEND
jgi:hypothetical protein